MTAPSRNWWCPTCQGEVPPERVTYEETHDPRSGGCGSRVLDRAHGVSAALTPREVELLREIRVNFGNLDRLSADWRNEARNLLLRIEQGNAGVAGTLKENGND